MKFLILLMLLGAISGYWLNPKAVDEPRQTTMTPDSAREKDCENYLKIMIYKVCEGLCIKGTYEKLLVRGCKSKMEIVFIKEVCCPHHY